MSNKINLIRQEIDEYFDKGILLFDDIEKIPSPDGQYYIIASPYQLPKPGCQWTVLKIEILLTETNEKLFDFIRNDDSLFYLWCNIHQSVYLFLSEDVMGQSVYDFIGRTFYSYSSGKADFIWSRFLVSPDQRKIAVEGCYWGSDDGIIIYDITRPTALPLSPLTGFTPTKGRDMVWNGDNIEFIELR